MKKTIKFNDFLEFVVENEDFRSTIAEYTGMSKAEVKAILLKYGKNEENPDIEVIIDERKETMVGMLPPTGYHVYVDGASRGNPGPSGVGVVIYDGQDEVKRVKKYMGELTNNEAEYEALHLAVKEALKLKYYSIRVFSDSELLVKQINGEYRVLDSKLKKLYKAVYKDIHKLTSFRLKHTGRRSNQIADQLANEAIDEESK